jgi:hypothetical protein
VSFVLVSFVIVAFVVTAVFPVLMAAVSPVPIMVVVPVPVIPIVAGLNPIDAAIYRRRPVAGAPEAAWSCLIPVTIDPVVPRTRTRRRISNNRRRRRIIPRTVAANTDPNRDVRFRE